MQCLDKAMTIASSIPDTEVFVSNKECAEKRHLTRVTR